MPPKDFGESEEEGVVVGGRVAGGNIPVFDHADTFDMVGMDTGQDFEEVFQHCPFVAWQRPSSEMFGN